MNETIKNIKAILTGMGHTMTERERQVLEQRFGLVDGYSRTLEEVSRQFKTTAARIKEIELRALAKMSKYTSLNEKESAARLCLGPHPQTRDSRRKGTKGGESC
jgi:DNA-directed RNA polymerase sigma subunit (sigma70/sigma32)